MELLFPKRLRELRKEKGISDIRKPYAVLEKADLIRLYNRAAELAKECRRHLSV